MKKLAGVTLILIGAAAVAMAGTGGSPQIDPGSAASALALLTGAALVIRGRRRN